MLTFGISSIVVLLLALSVHESAHAWAADRLGDPTARRLGRVSMNPLVHADLFGTFLVPLMLFFFSPVIFGWAKPVPVDIRNLPNPKRDYMLVAGAGPASNLVMASALFLLLLVIKVSSPDGELLVNQAARGVAASAYGWVGILMSMAYTGILINLILAIFNLIPVAPLDGAAVLSGLLPDWLSKPLESIQSFGFIILIGLLYLGIPNYLFVPVIDVVADLLTI